MRGVFGFWFSKNTACSLTGYGVGHVLNDLCASMWFTYLLLFYHKVPFTSVCPQWYSTTSVLFVQYLHVVHLPAPLLPQGTLTMYSIYSTTSVLFVQYTLFTYLLLCYHKVLKQCTQFTQRPLCSFYSTVLFCYHKDVT